MDFLPQREDMRRTPAQGTVCVDPDSKLEKEDRAGVESTTGSQTALVYVKLPGDKVKENKSDQKFSLRKLKEDTVMKQLRRQKKPQEDHQGKQKAKGQPCVSKMVDVSETMGTAVGID
ncbi:hypothetical protein llap_16202 [Limosa lapponica baueri]|uniref:Uncharacterized protein n=1 Tax=Limosa lapponica baueri TaxID=1758121 RepID=A0A2I0TI92_LIMLA|nr:hypothetical protein llap_16202 [Limosa lapponica baueri]